MAIRGTGTVGMTPSLPSLAKDLETVLGDEHPKPKPKKASIREDLRVRLGEDIAEDMANSIHAALDSMKTEWIECEHCRRKTAFSIPNMYERVKAAQLVIEQLEGKVGTQREAPQAPNVKVGDMADMTDDELLALLHAPNPTEAHDAD